MTNGTVEIWRGRSLFDGAPIRVVLTGLARPSSNAKTGGMVQAYIISADVSPGDAVRAGTDGSVCGDCPLRRGPLGRACYVSLAHGVFGPAGDPARPLARLALPDLRGRTVRLGAYGDPAAVPTEVWRRLVAGSDGWTGYTHAWRACDPALRELIMASVDDPSEASEAQAAGWRTFRVRLPAEGVVTGEIDCPAVTRGVQCADCRLCAGWARPAKHISIVAHGTGSGAYARLRAAREV